MAAAPWLFSEREVRDLMRLKKPLFLDSRFLSAASWTPVDGPFTPGSLKEMENFLSQICSLLHADDTRLFFSLNTFFKGLCIQSLGELHSEFSVSRYQLHLSPRLLLEAEFDDFLAEEIIQALIQLPHDAVLLCLLCCGAAGSLPLMH